MIVFSESSLKNKASWFLSKIASLVFDILNEVFSNSVLEKFVFFKLQSLKEVFINFALIKRELYKSDLSKDDWKDVIPLKLFWTKSLFVNSVCENSHPANEENWIFDSALS